MATMSSIHIPEASQSMPADLGPLNIQTAPPPSASRAKTPRRRSKDGETLAEPPNNDGDVVAVKAGGRRKNWLLLLILLLSCCSCVIFGIVLGVVISAESNGEPEPAATTATFATSTSTTAPAAGADSAGSNLRALGPATTEDQTRPDIPTTNTAAATAQSVLDDVG